MNYKNMGAFVLIYVLLLRLQKISVKLQEQFKFLIYKTVCTNVWFLVWVQEEQWEFEKTTNWIFKTDGVGSH